MRALTLTLGMLFLVAACTSNEPSTTIESSTAPTGDRTAPTTTSTTETTATTRAPESQTTTTGVAVTEGPVYIEGIVLPAVTLLTAPSGGGERPLLEWEPAEDAAWYQAIVINPDGVTYWNWPTEDTSVWVSGVESTTTRAPGPRISAGMSWAVLAFDENDQLIAQSQRRPIAP